MKEIRAKQDLSLILVVAQKPIIFLIGVAGCGKSSVGKMLAQTTNLPFYDGDDFHSAEHKMKMREGRPLTDEDRKGWLLAINAHCLLLKSTGGVIACSALKEKYRKMLSKGIENQTHWVLLAGSYSMIEQRLKQRKGHFFNEKLLSSQFDILEVTPDLIQLSVESTIEEITLKIVNQLHL